ncbi:MAG: M16 family metallopeptidase [Solirubrobacterales bacterium]
MSAAETPQVSEFPSGVRVVTESVRSVRSVALGLWVGTGSRNETPAQAGVSHFLEHLLFKGTKRYTAVELNEQFDSIGAAFNAATSKETTHVFARFLDDHTERAYDLMAEMLLGPTYPEDEVTTERQVVIEEIAMYEDEPSDKVHDVLDEAIFGDHPLGRRVIGSADVVGSIPIPDIRSYHDARYTGQNIVVAAAGNLEHDAIVALTERLLDPAPGSPGGDQAAPADGGPTPPRRSRTEEAAPDVAFQEKDTEQYHLCLGATGISRSDDRRFALRVLNTLFGGSSSSRLFTEVREKRGLAYSVGSYTDSYRDAGMIALYVGTREENVGSAFAVIGAELARLASEKVSAEELDRAKESVKGRLVLAQESTGSRMGRLATSVLFDLPILSLDEMLEKIDSVAAAEIHEIAADLYRPERFSAACIGRSEETFREALAPVSEALVAA